MNLPKVIAGTAVLLLAAFWAVLLLDYLTAVGYVVVLVAPFVTLLAFGAYGVLDGILGGISWSGKSSAGRGGRVSPLATAVLKMVAEGKNKSEISAATAVSLAEIEKKMEALTKAGFLVDDALSEKGYDVVKGSG